MQLPHYLIRFLKFGMVGGLGIFVNSALLYAGYDLLGFSLNIASPVAIVIAIFFNFNLNNFWTWKERRMTVTSTFVRRMGRYYLSAALGAVINYGVLILCVRYLAVYYLIANLLGILLGTVSNFLCSEFWVFSERVAKN
jgi:dolichol-phosphate mannosyltransferase